MTPEEYKRIAAAREKLNSILKQERNAQGFWEGHLSSSALSTAVALFALHLYDAEKYSQQIKAGLLWLIDNINEDGGWGDTIHSRSNLSTTLLCWFALSVDQHGQTRTNTDEHIRAKVEGWLCNRCGSLEPEAICAAVLDHYGKDRTFSVPILTMGAIAGCLGSDGWKLIPQLPFELAVFPDAMFKSLKLSVVSYAIPALIAIGLVHHRKKPTFNPVMRLVRKLATPKVLKVLAEKQPDNGGFLEATPLTAFVLMSLISAGEKGSSVSHKAAAFLADSFREDGSWPIDTNLATWVTTLSVNGLADALTDQEKALIADWLLGQQYTHVHPFTNAAPGGWAWTDLPGGVPDADDTSGALVALLSLADIKQTQSAAERGIQWLVELQNSDGGLPTFCKGWGTLPFDKSCPDITAHAILACSLWLEHLPAELQPKASNLIKRGISFLERNQLESGSWNPLWFGNEDDDKHCNPVYGTAQVLRGLSALNRSEVPALDDMIKRGQAFLTSVQNDDGGWGGNATLESTMEETALATSSFLSYKKADVAYKGTIWLANKIEKNEFEAAPIGLYFASLWYYEKLYPLTFAAGVFNHPLYKLQENK